MVQHYIGLIQDGLHESLVHWLMNVEPTKCTTRQTLETLIFFCDANTGNGLITLDELHKNFLWKITKPTLKRHVEILSKLDVIFIPGDAVGKEFSFFLNNYEFNDKPLLEKLEKQSYDEYLALEIAGAFNFERRFA